MRLLLLLPLLTLPFQNAKLSRVKISEDISIKVPEDFTEVEEGQMINRHVHFRQPLAFYTDPGNLIDLAFNQNPTQWREADLVILKDFYKSNILNLYDDVDFIREELVEIRGKQFAVFEFISAVKGDQNSIRNSGSLKKYTYIQYTIFKGTTLVSNLTTPANVKSRWAPVAAEVMNSIAFKE